MARTGNKRILVVGPSWVGDMIMSQCLYKYLKKRHPDAEIDVLAPAASLPLVGRMREVRMGIRIETGHGDLQLGYRRRLGEKLKEREYDKAFVLPNSFKSALVPFFADIPVRVGFRGEYRYVLINDMRMLSPRRLPTMTDRFLALAVPAADPPPPLEYPELFVDEANQKSLLELHRLAAGRPVLGLCPGAEYGDAKRWPAQHFATLARHAIHAGFDVWLFGGPADIEAGETVTASLTSAESAHCRNLAGATRLQDAIDLLSLCSHVVSNDSGLMHMAAAVGCPLTVVYGSTTAAFTPPLSAVATVLSDNLPCSPCFKRTCPLGHKDCLNKLLPERVFPQIDAAARKAVRL
ncbi:MAG: lipopolysaccharide heptosyltransferase II [Pseudomonadota bacterium]